MIERLVEYGICCDSERFGDESGCTQLRTFGSSTAEHCAERAKQFGWVQMNKKLWLCPECAKRILPIKSREPAGDARREPLSNA